MDCEDVFSRLSPSLDGELPAADAAAVERHVLGCAACARQRAVLEATREAFRSLASEGGAPGLEAAVLERVRSPRRVAWWLSGVAALLVAGFLFAREPARIPSPLASRELPPASTSPRDAGLEQPGLDCGTSHAAAFQTDAPCGEGLCAPDGVPVLKRPRLVFTASN